MPPAYLIRRVGFTASHHYGHPDLSESENRRTYGQHSECHTHEWTLEVELRGTLDPRNGFLVDLSRLDDLLEGVVGPLRDRSLNEVIEEVEKGTLQPSTEALAYWFWGAIEPGIPAGVSLVRVRVEESPELWGEYRGEEG